MTTTLSTTRDLSVLLACGRNLDKKLRGAITIRELLCRVLLRIRDRNGALIPLHPNRAQREFSDHCGKRSIVLKARQMGISTWVAARFFLHVITHPGAMA